MVVRVLHVLGGGLVAGGNETAALSVIREHNRANFDPTLVVLSTDRDVMAHDFERAGVPIVLCQYDSRRPWSFAWKLARLTRTIAAEAVLCYSFSIIHVWVHLAAALGGASRRLTRVAGWPTDPRRLRKLRWVNQLGRPLCTNEIAVSRYVGSRLRKLGGYPAERISIIPNGCAVEDIRRRADAARLVRRRGDSPRIVMVARMDEAKDQDTLIQATALVRQELPDIQLMLVGDGTRRQHLEQLAVHAGVDDAVEFLGARRDVPELLGQGDLFVLSTHTEGFPNVLIEAMAAGTPVIASDIPPCREILSDGTVGHLTPPANPRAMAGSIATLLASQMARQRIADAAFKWVRSQYELRRAVHAYEQLLGGSSGPLSVV